MRIFYSLLLIFITFNTLAQNGDIDVAPDNIDNNFDFGSNLVQNINYSTGVISPSFPITTLNGHSINCVVLLKYNSGAGIKVNDVASNVGLGFELQAGGFIKRTIRGIPDDSPKGWLELANASHLNSKFPELYRSNWYYEHTHGNNFTHYLEDTQDRDVNTAIDSESDIYEYNVNGKSGKFVFDNNGNAITIPYSTVIINPIWGSNVHVNWEIITEDGTKYIFPNTVDFKTDVTEQTNTGKSDDPNTQTDESNDTRTYTSQWFLSKIIGTEGEETNLYYEALNSYSIVNFNQAVRDFIKTPSNYSFPLDEINYQTTSTLNLSTVITFLNAKRLIRIESSIQKLEFIYSSINRKDIPALSYLEYIKKFNKFSNNLAQKFKFNYKYTISPGSNDSESYRLFLTSLTFEGSYSKDVQIKFKYNENNILPKRNSFQQDLWGYFNSNSASTLIPAITTTNCPLGVCQPTYFYGANRQIDVNRVQTGILNKIELSSGYYIELKYQCNEYFNSTESTNMLFAGVRLSEMKICDLGNSDVLYKQNINYDNITMPGQSSGGVTADYNSYELCNFSEIHELDGPHGNILYLYMTRTCYPFKQNSFDIIRYKNATIDVQGKGKRKLTFTGYDDNYDVQPERFIYDGNNSVQPLNTLNFQRIDAPKEFNSDKSYERGLIKVIEFYDDYNTKIKDIEYQYDFNPSTFTPKFSINLRVGSKFTRQMMQNMNDGEYYLTGLWNNQYNFLYYILSSSWIALTQKQITDYDASGNRITSKIKFTYCNTHINPVNIETIQPDGSSQIVINKYVSEYLDLTNLSPNNIYTNAIRLFQQKHIDKVIENVNINKKCDVCDEYITSGALNYFTPQTLTNGYINGLIAKEFELHLNVPILKNQFQFSEIQQIQNGTNNPYEIIKDPHYKESISYNAYTSTGDILEIKSKEQPLISFKYDKCFLKCAEFINAKSFYNLTNYGPTFGSECGFIDFENVSISGMYIENDFWNVDHTTICQTEKHTGYKSQKLEPATNNPVIGAARIFLPENQYQKFRFSAWVLNTGNYTATQGGALVIEVKHENGSDLSGSFGRITADLPNTNGMWKFVELIFDLGTFKNSHSLGGEKLRLACHPENRSTTKSIFIDELHFQPVNSVSSSITYNNQFTNQVTSLTNQNNLPVFCEYDDMGRQITLRDKDNNILKEFYYDDGDYTFKNEDLIILKYKNNCPVNNVASSVNYTVISGAFTSLMHQQEIDDQLDNAAQINANNLGTCTPCNNEGYKVINNICVLGTYILDSSEFCGFNNFNENMYRAHYHYHWPDGSDSQNYIGPCED